ncbi:MAG TPA: hypothetical protein DHV59_13855 [Oxalobacteraceae bacterium]|nr:hypothetical protein [Oxalobacteraceae bacterium]
MEGLLVLEQFVEFWRNHPGFQVDSFGNATFQGMVEARYGRASAQCTTLVRIWRYGHETDTIRLRKEAGFFADFPHLDFAPPSNEYKLRGADHALTISGHSDQLDKEFVVSILPAEAKSTRP